MSLAKAIAEAKSLTRSTRREYVVRNSGFYGVPCYFVAPRYEPGFEGYRADLGYAGLGLLVWVPGGAE